MSPAIPQPPQVADNIFYRVPYAETDQMGRVYYGNYLTWFERGRTELLRESGFPYRVLEERDIWLPVRHCEVRYYGAAKYDDEVRLCSWVSQVRRASVTITTNVYRQPEDELITTGSVELVCTKPNGKPQPFPEDLQKALTAFLAAE